MNDALSALWEQVAHIARARVALVIAALDALQQATPDAPALQAAAATECHKLIGSLDSYGRHGGSQLAQQAAALLEEPDPDLAELSAVIARLLALVAAAPETR